MLTTRLLHRYRMADLRALARNEKDCVKNTINGQTAHFALGHGGQYIMNIPARDMVVVAKSDASVDWTTADEQERGVLGIIADYVLPAVVASSP